MIKQFPNSKNKKEDFEALADWAYDNGDIWANQRKILIQDGIEFLSAIVGGVDINSRDIKMQALNVINSIKFTVIDKQVKNNEQMGYMLDNDLVLFSAKDKKGVQYSVYGCVFEITETKGECAFSLVGYKVTPDGKEGFCTQLPPKWDMVDGN